METLGQKQQRFALMVGRLIVWISAKPGYGVTFGDAYRSPQQAAENAKAGTGIANSLHTQRLAVDLNLFINNAWMTDHASYLPLGEYWEQNGGSWGGRFKKDDADHFSLEHNGVR